MNFGRTSCGWSARLSYQPTIEAYVEDINQARARNMNPADAVPLPAGWTFNRERSQLLLEPTEEDFHSYKHSFGYVATIHDANSTDTASPLCLTVVLKLPFKYGSTADEYYHSYAWARVNAFASKAYANFTPSGIKIFLV